MKLRHILAGLCFVASCILFSIGIDLAAQGSTLMAGISLTTACVCLNAGFKVVFE